MLHSFISAEKKFWGYVHFKKTDERMRHAPYNDSWSTLLTAQVSDSCRCTIDFVGLKKNDKSHK